MWYDFLKPLISTVAIIGTLIGTVTSLTYLDNDPLQIQYNKMENYSLNNQHFDFITVGLGAAGSVIANRLTENLNTRVLVLEAGGRSHVLESKAPLLFGQLMKSELDWKLYNEKDINTNNRDIYLPRGKGPGGSGNFYTMVYARGKKEDYDNWKYMGNEDWGWNEVLPYFKKAERNYINNLDPKFHNSNGTWHVANESYTHEMSHIYMQTLINAGAPLATDPNNGTDRGVYRSHTNIYQGQRKGPYNSYLTEDVINRNNLYIKINANVNRLLFDGKKVIGVEFTDLTNGQLISVFADKEVILAAGALKTPQLLLLSGIGPSPHLQSLNISVNADLPVGIGLKDHALVGVTYIVTENAPETIETHTGNMDSFVNIFYQWLTTGTGPLTSNVGEIYWPSGYGKEITYEMAPVIFYNDGLGAVPVGKRGVSFGPNLEKPLSVGYVKLKTANPQDPPLINHKYFSVQSDLDIMVDALKYIRNITKSFSPLKDYIQFEFLPGNDTQSDSDIATYIKNYVMSGYHHCCTARMGKRNDGISVVDHKLRVFNVKNLRVVDSSIMPEIPSANIMAPIVMIAEKASDLIKSEYNL